MAKKGSTSGGSPSARIHTASDFEREFPGGSESANASVVALVRTYDALIGMTNDSASTSKLSAAGRQALAIIEGAGGPLSPTEISQRMFVTTASTTSLLDTLERRGLLARLPDPDDRRKVLVTLTNAGQQVVDEFLPRVIALQTAALSGLSEAERKQLLRHLATIRETVAEIDSDSVAKAAPRRAKPRRS